VSTFRQFGDGTFSGPPISQERPEFQDAVAQAREEWDNSFPAFAIGDAQYRPPDEEDSFKGVLRVALYPHRLGAAIAELHTKQAESTAIARSNRDRTIIDAAESWFALVRRLSREWWPREHFPLGEGGTVMGHPAGFFVAGCLIYLPDSIPESWIVRHTPNISSYAYDPDYPETHPEAVWWRTYALALERGVLETVSAGKPLSRSDYDEIQQNAWNEALTKSDESRRKYPDEWSWYVRLFPGMTSSDWRALEPRVLQTIEHAFQATSVARLAQRLFAEGMSLRQIAFTLGISRRQAARYVDGMD
jgi:hypothetical protein